jgi:ribosome maturation factor RimP
MEVEMTELQAEIEQRLADAEPQVEVLLAEVLASPPQPTLRVFIDHPDGVTLSLCEQVSALLGDMRERYTLEVSSPGSERPLSKPDHFRRYIGRRARVRVRGPQAVVPSCGGADPRTRSGERRESRAERRGAGRAGTPVFRRSYTGELVGASDSEITLAAEGGIVAIPYSEIRRCNLVEE